MGPGARDAAPGERQVALDLRPALGVRNDHGVRQDPAAARPHLGHSRGSGAVARRRPGLGVAGEAREPWGVSRDAENRRYHAGHFFQPGLGNCGRLRRPGVGRGARLFTARSASEVRSGQRCSRSRRSSASPPRNCQPALAGLCQPAAVPGGGRGQKKAPRSSQSEACFPGRRGRHLPPEPAISPISIEKHLGTLGAVVGLEQMLQTFARRFSQTSGNTR